MKNITNSQKVKFSLRRVLKVISIIAAIFLVGSGIYFLAMAPKTRIIWAGIVYDRREHYLSCTDLPFYPEVKKSMQQHQDMVNKVKSLGALSLSPVEINCPSSVGTFIFLKGDILITYKNRSQRKAIESTVGNTFFGIPYRGEQEK